MAQPKKKSAVQREQQDIQILNVLPVEKLPPAGITKPRGSKYDDLLEAVSKLQIGEVLEVSGQGDPVKTRNAIYVVLRRWLGTSLVNAEGARLSVRVTKNNTIGIYCMPPRKKTK